MELNFAKNDIAVMIPCFNEQQTIHQVVTDFKKYLPNATIYVYDNNSTDQTVNEALQANAIVRHEGLQGKGNVVRRMFSDIDADVYVLVDGDATYDAASALTLIHSLLTNHLDMINAARVNESKEAYRMGHTFGNKLLTSLVKIIFGNQISDMLSGYRVFSRRFVKSFPILSTGFEIETELTVHALSLRMPIAEIKTPYYQRPLGSFSKLSTFKDGWRILSMIIGLLRNERPLAFFSLIGVFLFITSLILAEPLFVTYWQTGLVPRIPTAILCTSLTILAFLNFACGLILDTVTRGRKEAKLLSYLSYQKNHLPVSMGFLQIEEVS